MKRILRVEIFYDEESKSLQSIVGTNDYDGMEFDKLCETFVDQVSILFGLTNKTKTNLKG